MPILPCQTGFDWTAPSKVSASPARTIGRADYEERRHARIERQRGRAERMRRVAESQHARAREIGSHIPFGQPVLIGHHSQKRHERDIARIDRAMRSSIEASKEAEALERRASAAERNRAVSSDDPEAVRKLKEKLRSLEDDQRRMVEGNKAVRAGKSAERIAEVTRMSVAKARELKEADWSGRFGFPDYAIKNTGAEIRRVKKRIEALETTAATPVRATEHIGNVEIREEDNRVKLIFLSHGKPAESVRAALKGAGFRWSPTAGAWQRHASVQAWYHARRIAAMVVT